MHFQRAIVLDKAQLPESVHEKTYSGARGADNLGQSLLADFWNYLLRFTGFAEICQQEQNPGQSLLTGVEELIYKISLEPDVSRKYVHQKHFGERRLLAEDTNQDGLFQAHDRTW